MKAPSTGTWRNLLKAKREWGIERSSSETSIELYFSLTSDPRHPCDACQRFDIHAANDGEELHGASVMGFNVSDAFPLVFTELRAIMVAAAPDMVVTEDTPTQFTMKTAWLEKRTRQPAWFGWIAVKKTYVAYHVMPLYTLPDLNDAIPVRLEKHRQGKTCFNFKKVEPDLFEDLRILTELAARKEPELKATLG